MRELPGWVRILLVGQFVSTVGSLAWLFVTLYLVEDRGMSLAAAGVVAAMNGVGTIGGNLLGGAIGDRFGLRRTLLVFTCLSIVLLIAVPLSPTGALGAVLLAVGFVGGVRRPVSFALITSALPADQRRQAVAWSRASFNAGVVIGPPLGGLLAAYNFDLIFVVDGLSTMVMLAAISQIPRTRATIPHDAARRSVWSALRADPRMVLLLAAIVLVDTAYRFSYSALPLQLRDSGAEPWVYGTLIALNGLVIVLFEPWLAARLAGQSAVRLMTWGFVLVAVGWMLLVPTQAVLAAVAAIVVGTVGEMLYKPTATAHAADRAPDGMHGRFQSLYAAASISGTVLAPPLATNLLAIDARLTWVVGAGLGFAAAALMFVWRRLPAGAADEPKALVHLWKEPTT
jgi:predicted MFS family arabinose efflux permease